MLKITLNYPIVFLLFRTVKCTHFLYHLIYMKEKSNVQSLKACVVLQTSYLEDFIFFYKIMRKKP